MKWIFILVLLFGCGGTDKETKVVERPAPPGGTNPLPPGGGKVNFAQISGITQEFCSACHQGAGFLQAEDSFRRSAACRRVENRTMPPQNSRNYGDWTDELRQIVVNFCRGD